MCFLNVQFFEYFRDYLELVTKTYRDNYLSDVKYDSNIAHVLNALLRLIWYTSDYFYWLIYFGTFVEKRLISSNDNKMSSSLSQTKFNYYIKNKVYF